MQKNKWQGPRVILIHYKAFRIESYKYNFDNVFSAVAIGEIKREYINERLEKLYPWSLEDVSLSVPSSDAKREIIRLLTILDGKETNIGISDGTNIFYGLATVELKDPDNLIVDINGQAPLIGG